MKTKIVSQLDSNGYFISVTVADESPLEPGVFILPFGAVDIQPPSLADGKFARYVNGSWTYESVQNNEYQPFINVPYSITPLQALLALDHEGMASLYEEWATAPERTFAQKAFINKAMTWRRDDPTLDAAATDLGLTAEQVDNLFILAAAL